MKLLRPTSDQNIESSVFVKVAQARGSSTANNLNSNNLLPEFQSAYRREHSTESTVLKVFFGHCRCH